MVGAVVIQGSGFEPVHKSSFSAGGQSEFLSVIAATAVAAAAVIGSRLSVISPRFSTTGRNSSICLYLLDYCSVP